jgi:predicted Zn finger-like uncharacterized protein|tara:strand:- start:998 stop:1510 length:513 start_codon:yes stop_codon:yes gene_type:complete
MILSCNSCEKRFVIPDQAITAAGRTVQCGSCGNKWRQFPIKSETTEITSEKKINIKKTPVIRKVSRPKKEKVKKIREINLYSPEYLEKKHGISLKDEKTNKNTNISKKISFGFYNSLILFVVFTITLSKGLHFFQDFIVKTLPFTEFYLDYFFESIRNMFEIWKNLFSNY